MAVKRPPQLHYEALTSRGGTALQCDDDLEFTGWYCQHPLRGSIERT